MQNTFKYQNRIHKRYTKILIVVTSGYNYMWAFFVFYYTLAYKFSKMNISADKNKILNKKVVAGDPGTPTYTVLSIL